MAENNNIKVGGRLHSIATGNVLAGANEILDDTINKKQSEINTETYRLVENINESLENLNPEQTQALSVAAKANNNEVKLGYFECETESDIADKVITNATGYILSKGGSIKIKMINANSASNVTLNINSTGAKTLYYNGELASPTNTWENNEIIEVYYDGNNYYYANNIEGASKFATGEKIKEVGIDDEPTAGSNNLIKSGGVNEAITRVAPKISYIGLGTGVVYATSNILNNLIPGHEYRIQILNPHALDNISTGSSPKFSIIIDDGNNQQTVVSVRGDAGSLQDYYDILMPEGYTNLYLYGRATEGLEFIAYAEDVTSAQKIEAKNKKFVFSENIYKSIKLDKIALYQHGIALNNKFMPKELFESGAIYFNSDSISYSTNSKRIRTKEGCKVFLKAGDIIYVGNGKRVSVSYFDDDDNYHLITNWKSISYQIVVPGYYCIMLANDPDAEISSIDTFLDTCYFYNNGNLEEVKESVNVLQEVTQFPISGYLDTSGQPVDNALLSITNYIKVEPSKRYRVVTDKLVMSNRLNYATYYSEDGINFTYRDGKHSVYGSLDIKIPQNANYIRIGKFNSYNGTYGQLGLYDLTEFTRGFGSFMFYDNHHTHGRKLWSNAVITNNNEYTSSSFISNVYYYNVVGLKRIGFIINAVDTYKMYCAFYDVDYNYLSSKNVISSNPAFDIPNNTVYIKIGLSKIENNVAISTTPDDVSLGMISIDFSQLKTIDGIENLSRYFGNTYQNVDKYLQDMYENFLGFTEKDITLTANKSIRYSDGAYSDKDGYSISDSIFIKEGVTIRYRTYIANENWCSLAVFDKNGVYKKADSARKTLGESIIEFTASYDCYIRVSCDTSRLSLLYFSFSGIRASVPNRLKDLEASAYDSGVKDYWLSYLQNKQADINAGIASVGTHGDILIFFSDYHLVANECQSPYLIKYLTERYNIDKVICGGDILNTHNSKEVALGIIEDFNRSFSFTTLYNIFGNHDDNPYGGSANILTVDEYYPLLFKHLENKVHMNRGCYYYFDNDFQKIRYIVLNTHGNGFDLTNAEDIEQLNWFCSTLNSVQNGWYVVVMSHMYYEVYENQETHLHYVDVSAGGLIYPITDAYQSKTSASMSKSGVTYNFNFTSANGKIACLLVGHVHSDYSEVRLSETSPYPIISIEQDSTYYTGPVETDPQRTKGTTSEQAFDIVCIDTTNKQIKTIRIGAGEDRTFSFT